MALHIALIQPQIPPNTGNIARLCAATDTSLHLIEPLGFSINDSEVRRAGLDYWDAVDLWVHPNWFAFRDAIDRSRCLYFSAKATQSYWAAHYSPNSCLVFGSETEGMPQRILEKHPELCFRIPMTGPVRSLNLATAVGIVLYEGIRQTSRELGARSQELGIRKELPTPDSRLATLYSGTFKVDTPHSNLNRRALRMLAKVAVVGAGNVGATAAQRLAEKSLARTVVMIDVVDGVPQGKGLDQWQSAPIEGFDTRIVGSQSYDEAAGADVFVVTAGIARKPGMSRDDLVKTNAGIVRSVAEQIARVAPKSIIVVVSNPLDVMCYVAMKASGFPRERIVGMAGVLDTARYRMFLAQALEVSVEDIQAMVLGGHGDTMVPLVSYTTVSGIPVTQLIDRAKLDEIVARTRNGGAEIVSFLKTGSAYYAPSAAAVQMVEAIALDKKRILPCSAWLQGEFGLRDVFCGVPCKIGRAGLERVIEVILTREEQEELRKSAEAVRSTQAVVDG